MNNSSVPLGTNVIPIKPIEQEVEVIKVTSTHDVSISINHDIVVDLIASHLYAIGVIPRKSTVIDIDLGLQLDVNGLVPMDVTLGIPPEEDE